MSLGAEMIGTVNTTTRNYQYESDNATNAGGASVVVWTDQFSSTDTDIRAQRYNSFGGKIGPEIVVAVTGLNEHKPSVAIDGRGDFVVTWTQDQANGTQNVLGRRYDPNGNAVGPSFPVALSSPAASSREFDADVAMDDGGNFVVSYSDYSTSQGHTAVVVKRFNASNQVIGAYAVGTSTNDRSHSSVSITPDGRFDVAWEQNYGPADDDIYLDRFAANGSLLGTNVISYSPAYDTTPSVSMDNAGDAVVAWSRNHDVKAVRVGPAGAQGAEINIASSSNLEDNPSVALRRGGGSFVVAYQSSSLTSLHVNVAEVSASNTVRTYDAGERNASAVSIDAFGNYLVTYQSLDGFVDTNIRARRGFLLS